MPQGKQAKIISPRQESAILRHLETTRYPHRDKVVFLLSVKAGLRAKEIASVTWAMVTNSEGDIGDSIELRNVASKGKGGGRSIPMHPALQEALGFLKEERKDKPLGDNTVIYSERGLSMTVESTRLWFRRLYDVLGMTGCSSHSGRRTFITRAARKASEAGGSIRDVQELAGHASMQNTQRYIEGSSDAKRKLVGLI